MSNNFDLAISRSKTLFQLVWERSIDGMRLIDENGTMLLVNDAFCKMIGMEREELIGKSFSIIYYTEQDKMAKKEKERFIKRDIAPHFERELTLWNKKKIWFELSNNYLQDDNGALLLLSIFRDITERKRAEAEIIAERDLIRKYSEELREINASKDKFFSIISHDLKSPFQSMLGISDLLVNSSNGLGSKEKEMLIHQLNKSIHNQYKLLENLLQWSRLQTGRINYLPRRVDMGWVIGESFNLLGGNAAQKSIELRNEIGDECIVYADLSMVSSIAQNLISNAIKFTPRDGYITVSCTQSGDYYQISVADTGIGIHEEDFPKIFRLDCSYSTLGTENEGGTGLGLVICKEMVEKNCGELSVESTPGKGTVFTFSLPKYYDI